MMLIKWLLYLKEPFFAAMVMPRSRSRSMESMSRSATTWLSRNMPLCLNNWSTSVVLPWSTCEIMAILRIKREFMGLSLPNDTIENPMGRLTAACDAGAYRIKADNCLKLLL